MPPLLHFEKVTNMQWSGETRNVYNGPLSPEEMEELDRLREKLLAEDKILPDGSRVARNEKK